MDISSFILKVKSILAHEKILKKERFQRGEDFNIFSVMGMETSEVNTHSAIVSSLLNPKGSHGCGDTFLKLFISIIPELKDFEFGTEKAQSRVEVSIGHVSQDYEEGGRLDILIESGGKAIIIENKIDACDQPHQMFRYYEYAEKHYKDKYKLIYLTKNGKLPSDNSIAGNGYTLQCSQDYFCLSYANEISRWIDLCIINAIQKPLLRETLVQYKNLLNKLTNQDMESTTRQELENICSQPENIESLMWIHEHIESIVNKIMQSHFVPLLQQIANKHNLEVRIKNDGKDWINTQWMNFAFYSSSWKQFEIAFEFQKRGMQDCVSGYRYQDGKRDGINNETYVQLSKIAIDNKRSSEGWPAFRYFDGHSNWITEKMIGKILKDKQAITQMIEGELIAYLENARAYNINL